MALILVVEDNEANWDMLSRRLRRRGHDVLVAVDGQAGVDMARSRLPDVILLDMNLPIIDGWTAATMLKGDPATKNLPIVALTAHAMADDRDRAIAAGCDDYHSKPIQLPELLSQIDALINKSDATA